MFKTIVVGVDGTPGGQDALALALALASADSRVIAVNAFPYEIRPSRGSLIGYEEVMREENERLLAGWVADSDVERRVVVDISAGRALHFVAEDVGADLIVVGACHRSAPGRVLLGDVSRATLHGARWAVAIAPHGYRDGVRRIEQIGVGYTETAEAKAALRLAAALAAEVDGMLHICTAVPTPTPYVSASAYGIDWAGALAEDLKAAQETLDRVAAELSVPVRTQVVNQLGATALVELSRETDLMVVGSRGWGALKSILLGSTSDRLAHECHSPLIVVPRPAAEPPAASKADADALSAA